MVVVRREHATATLPARATQTRGRAAHAAAAAAARQPANRAFLFWLLAVQLVWFTGLAYAGWVLVS